MTIKLSLIDDSNIYLVEVSKVLGINELRSMQKKCEEIIQKIGHIKILIVISDFVGWEKADGWEDNSFSERNDASIDKIAIVGDEKWQDLAYVFTVKGLRPVEIEFFEESKIASATQWLNE